MHYLGAMKLEEGLRLFIERRTSACWPLTPQMNFPNHAPFQTKCLICFSVVAFGLLVGSTSMLADGNDQKFIHQLVHDVVATEVKAQEEDQSLWQYRQTKSQEGKNELIEVIETKQGSLQRIVAVNGHPLEPGPEQNEDARIQHLLHDREAFQKQRRKAQQDFAEELRLLQMLDEAFIYQDEGKDGTLRKLNFKPNRAFHPPNHEGEVFHHMEGTVWLDMEQKRLVRMSGVLTSDVKFGWGVLGHLAKGGTFVVEQREVGKGHWELTRLDVDMNGKALFFKTIEVKQAVRNFGFKPVSAEVTLQQAAEILKRDSLASEGRDSAARH